MTDIVPVIDGQVVPAAPPASARDVDADFRLVSTQAARGRPKNLIFASPVKPDIRIIDAINNDIEIVTNAESVLVYDRPTHEGVLWHDLQAWCKETRQITDDDEAKSTLYKRLRSSLPESSPPQRNLFDLYHHIYRDELPGLPALLLEVWLHWDPKTARERGPEGLLKFRMDFPCSCYPTATGSYSR